MVEETRKEAMEEEYVDIDLEAQLGHALPAGVQLKVNKKALDKVGGKLPKFPHYIPAPTEERR